MPESQPDKRSLDDILEACRRLRKKAEENQAEAARIMKQVRELEKRLDPGER